MREITAHKVEGKGGGKDITRVLVHDDPGPRGACHQYSVGVLDDPAMLFVQFQFGPIQEVGINGVQQEHLLAIVADRLTSFQTGPFANDYNAEALEHVNAALAALKRRTTDRIARKVEGYNVA